MTLFPDARVAFRLILRARIVSISVWLTVVVLGAAWMASVFSGRQPATIALDVGLSLIRLTVPFVAVLQLQELVTREFDRRFFLASLTYPRPRHQFLLGRLFALGGVMALLVVVLAAALAVLVAWVESGYAQATPVGLGLPYWITVSFVLLDLFVVIALGALLAVVASTPSFVLIGTLGFMLVARSYSTIVALLEREAWLVSNAETYHGSLGLLAYVLPDLAALDVRMIALYGQMSLMPSQWPWHVGTALAYGVGLVAMATWLLARKRFA